MQIRNTKTIKPTKTVSPEYAIIDTETTGMHASYGRVIDIGIIRVRDGKIIDTKRMILTQ